MKTAKVMGAVVVVFALFHVTASLLGSDRGQLGIVVCAVVLGTLFAAERWLLSTPLSEIAGAMGLTTPAARGMLASLAVSAAMLAVVPVFLRATGSTATFTEGAVALIPGLFAQAGIAEETLFRGFLFGHLRKRYSFWRAVWVSMVPFVAAHLLLFTTMPWPIALSALVLSCVTSFPFAHLYELGGQTIWAPALLHFVVQGTVKLVAVKAPGDSSGGPPLFPLVWMATSAVLPLFTFLISSRRSCQKPSPPHPQQLPITPPSHSSTIGSST